MEDVSLGEMKPENTVGHVVGEAGDLAASAYESGDDEVVPVREVVCMDLGCVGADTHKGLGGFKSNTNAIFWNAGKIHSHEHDIVLKHLVLLKPFWPIHEKLVVDCVKPFCYQSNTEKKYQ